MVRAIIRHRAARATLLVTGALLAACGRDQGITGTGPMITIAVAPTTAVVHGSGAVQLAATVSNDASNRGVSWKVSCAAASCGAISPAATASGAVTTYTAPATLPSGGATITITATAIADGVAAASATLVPVGQLPGYDVGVDYHAYGLDNLSTAFITIYNQPAVRQVVRAQLQGMADRGATFVHTSIWFVTYPGTTNFGETWRATFPMTDQEAANLRSFAEDVAVVQGAGGNRLRLDVALMWLGASDYTSGTPATGLGYNKDLSASEFSSRVATTTDKVLAAVSDVRRPDGVRLVDAIFFDPEVMIGAKANEDWFLSTNYPRFVTAASQQGIRPSVYFLAEANQTIAFDDGYTDPVDPILDGHRSVAWMYRSLKFMAAQGLPLPSRIDFSCYLISTGATYDSLLKRVLDDADATLPSLGAPRLYGAAETYYLTDPTQRLQYGQAFLKQAALNARLQRVSFWTTPDGGGPGQNVAYPFAIEDYLPPPPP
jgi:hypothetical protein